MIRVRSDVPSLVLVVAGLVLAGVSVAGVVMSATRLHRSTGPVELATGGFDRQGLDLGDTAMISQPDGVFQLGVYDAGYGPVPCYRQGEASGSVDRLTVELSVTAFDRTALVHLDGFVALALDGRRWPVSVNPDCYGLDVDLAVPADDQGPRTPSLTFATPAGAVKVIEYRSTRGVTLASWRV